MIWFNNTFDDHYPVGTSAIVCAKTKEEAAHLLNKQLEYQGIPQREPVKPEDMKKFVSHEGNVLILNDGNY